MENKSIIKYVIIHIYVACKVLIQSFEGTFDLILAELIADVGRSNFVYYLLNDPTHLHLIKCFIVITEFSDVVRNILFNTRILWNYMSQPSR